MPPRGQLYQRIVTGGLRAEIRLLKELILNYRDDKREAANVTTAQALRAVQRRLDRWFALHLVQQKAAMISDGMNRDFVEGRLDRQVEYYLADRAEQLDEVHAWLLRCDGRLHNRTPINGD